MGVFIEETLSWSKHINEVSKDLSKINGVLYNLRRSLPCKLITSIYYALINSKLSYCLSVWGSGGAECSLSKLFAAQKRAVRTLYNVKRCRKLVKGHKKKVFNDNSIIWRFIMSTLNQFSWKLTKLFIINHLSFYSTNFLFQITTPYDL